MEGWAGTGSAETPGPSYWWRGRGGGWEGECRDPRAQLPGLTASF